MSAYKKIQKKVEAVVDSEDSHASDSEESVKKLESGAGSDVEGEKEEAVVEKVDSVSKYQTKLTL